MLENESYFVVLFNQRAVWSWLLNSRRLNRARQWTHNDILTVSDAKSRCVILLNPSALSPFLFVK